MKYLQGSIMMSAPYLECTEKVRWIKRWKER